MQNKAVFEEAKEYFYQYVFKPISGILYAQKIYKDFQASCISNKFYRDSFTDFVDVLYYKTMVTELCKQLDTPNKNKQNKDKNNCKNDDRNFSGFIMLLKQKEPEIFSMRSCLSIVNISTHTIINMDISDKIKTDFNRTKHDENLKKIESLFQIFRKYRNKIVCHQTYSAVEAPCRESIDKTISILEELLLMYSKLFGIHILLTTPNPVYRNPPLRENNEKYANK